MNAVSLKELGEVNVVDLTSHGLWVDADSHQLGQIVDAGMQEPSTVARTPAELLS